MVATGFDATVGLPAGKGGQVIVYFNQETNGFTGFAVRYRWITLANRFIE